jgi:polar amino acid transport system substrate-binding protein
MISHIKLLPFLFLIAAITACDGLPKDPSGTTNQILSRGTIKVGVIEHPPWVIRTVDGEPAGAEAELVKEFSQRLGVKPEWQWGGEGQLFSALEKYELDVVIGGLENTTPWSSRIGMTRPYFKEIFLIGVPSGLQEPKELKDQEVGVGPDPRLTALLREKKAVPVSIPPTPTLPVAGADWQMQPMGLRGTDLKLRTDNHIIATPPGENQLISRLERFLAERRDQIPEILRNQPEERE